MKTTLLTLFTITLGPVLMAALPPPRSIGAPSAGAAAPAGTAVVMAADGSADLKMANGTMKNVRKLLGITGDSLRVMTVDGVAKIPLKDLHPDTVAMLDGMRETPEQTEARRQREEAAAQSYREGQAEKDRLAAEQNAMSAAAQRAEAARQEAVRQANAEAYALQQQRMAEYQKQQDAEKAQRRAERAERIRIADAEDAAAAARQRQYEMEVAAAQAQQQAMQQQAQAQQGGPLAAMMTPKERMNSGVDKLDMNEQNALKVWVVSPSVGAPTNNTWRQKVDNDEREVLVAWLNNKRYANMSPAMRQQMRGPDTNNNGGMPISTYLRGCFDGFAPGKVFHLQNGQSYQQSSGITKSVTPFSDGTKVFVRDAGHGVYVMTIQGAGDINVHKLSH